MQSGKTFRQQGSVLSVSGWFYTVGYRFCQIAVLFLFSAFDCTKSLLFRNKFAVAGFDWPPFFAFICGTYYCWLSENNNK